MDEEVDANPSRREISLPEMRSFVADVSHPLERALIVTMLKTGMRVGELCNLDLRDLSIGAVDGLDRGTLDGRGDALYVSAEPRTGVETNGEVRSASNKRKRSTVVPVDEELQHVLSAPIHDRLPTRCS
jgi:integrase